MNLSLYLWKINFFHENPHLLFPAGFDEVKYVYGKSALKSVLADPLLNEEYIWGDDLFALFRWEKSGAWHWLHESPYFGGQFRFVRIGGTMGEGLAIPYDYVMGKLQNALSNPISNNCSIISPCLWTPESRKNEKTLLQTAAEEIIAALALEKIKLEDINWRQLEDVVAMLLIDKGIEIHKVVERPQGGKDLIVRGELIPGEPLSS